MGLLGSIGGFLKRAVTPPAAVRSAVYGSAAKVGRVFTPVTQPIKKAFTPAVNKAIIGQALNLVPVIGPVASGAFKTGVAVADTIAATKLQPAPPEPPQPRAPLMEGEHAGGTWDEIAPAWVKLGYSDPFKKETTMALGPRAGVGSPRTSPAHTVLRARQSYRPIPKHISRKYGEGDLGEQMAARYRRRKKKRRRVSLKGLPRKLRSVLDVLCVANDLIPRGGRRRRGRRGAAPSAYDLVQDRREARRGPSIRRRGRKMPEHVKQYLRSLRKRR